MTSSSSNVPCQSQSQPPLPCPEGCLALSKEASSPSTWSGIQSSWHCPAPTISRFHYGCEERRGYVLRPMGSCQQDWVCRPGPASLWSHRSQAQPSTEGQNLILLSCPRSPLSALWMFSLSETCLCQVCPFTKAQAHHSYCFKKNFLALRLKLNCPLRVSYFVCSCLLVAAPPSPYSPPLPLFAGSTKLRSISVWPPSLLPLKGAGQKCLPEADVPRVLLRTETLCPRRLLSIARRQS